MPLTLKTPGVYIEEKNAFPNSIVALPTAVPAFIGYTEKAELANGKSAKDRPIKINSISEYFAYFGGDIEAKFELPKGTKDDFAVKVGEQGKESYYKVQPVINTQGLLYNSIRLFYRNGGGSAYIISVGSYEDIKSDGVKAGALIESIDLLKREQEPTMLLIPDALLLDAGKPATETGEYKSVCDEMLKHCGLEMRSRVALFDVRQGYTKDDKNSNPVVNTFRESVGDHLDFGIAYYPWVHTTVVEDSEVNYLNFAKDAVGSDADEGGGGGGADALKELKDVLKESVQASITGTEDDDKKRLADIEDEIDKLDLFKGDENRAKNIKTAHQTMLAVSSVYKDLMKEVREQRNLLPVAPAMAGVYTMVDKSRGVWKAPANVGLNSVIAPAVSITSKEQEDLNVTLTGKSVNAIRSFVGEGVKVWGARTLDGNSQDWQYINVRRTLIFIEQSIKAAAKAYVFEPNDSNTWILMKGMLNNFLTNLWKQGALAGSSPGEAFNVQIGLGATMTPVDILDGVMRINVKVAITRPAEFIVITFQQKMQES